MAMMALGTGATYLVAVALKPIAAGVGWPRAVPSLCYSLALLSAGFGGLLWGSISDRISMARPALFGTVGMALGGWLGGQIFDLTGSYHSAFLVGAAFNLGNLAVVATLLLRQGRAVPRHAAA